MSSACKHFLFQYERPTFVSPVLQKFSDLTHAQKQRALKRLCGFKTIAADVHWLGFLQQDHVGKKLLPEQVFARADLITDLDPFFNVVYRFAAIGLTVGLKRPDLANKLLKKALHAWQVNGDDWLIYFYLGHNYHFFLNDDAKAARYIQLASEQPTVFDGIFKSSRLPPPDYLNHWAQRLALVAKCPLGRAI